MWLKLYLGTLYVDKVEVDFEDMETAKERERHLQKLSQELCWSNHDEIEKYGTEPLVFVHETSKMNESWFRDQTWEEIIDAVGSGAARGNKELLKELKYNRQKGVIEI